MARIKATGRPSTLYLTLLQEVIDVHGPGVRVQIKDFVDRTSAYTARLKLLDGSRPVPGDVTEWQFDAHVEDVMCEDGTVVRGSSLFATYLPHAAPRPLRKGKTP